jgi:hypothetical protein
MVLPEGQQKGPPESHYVSAIYSFIALMNFSFAFTSLSVYLFHHPEAIDKKGI